MRREKNRVQAVETTAGEIECGWVVNAAGLHCDDIAGMVGKADYSSKPRKGQFYILDKNTLQGQSYRASHPEPAYQGQADVSHHPRQHACGPTAEDISDKRG
jgi:glycerol-3-phosphate dehydrogenase